MSDDDTIADQRHLRLQAAASPRRAKQSDVPVLSRLFAAAFLADPVMDWIAQPGMRRAAGLERFFYWILTVRTVPFGEVWMSDDGAAAAAWLPPDAPASPGGFFEQIRLLPMFLRLCGLARMGRGSAMGAAMEKHHPHAPHYYLAFIATAPRFQGMGLGGALLDANLRRIDETGQPCWLENSNPRNTRLYERAGFQTRQRISPPQAPPLIGMWRDRKTETGTRASENAP
ncbi:MAG TPA: GNAT family N-acetyltransferase [Rhizomicrobium sp.]|nr:GNAT family N-acetyltransferase [Rhizomicrobium sp.]